MEFLKIDHSTDRLETKIQTLFDSNNLLMEKVCLFITFQNHLLAPTFFNTPLFFALQMRFHVEIEQRKEGTCHSDVGFIFDDSVQNEIPVTPGSKEFIAVRRLVKLWMNFAISPQFEKN